MAHMTTWTVLGAQEIPGRSGRHVTLGWASRGSSYRVTLGRHVLATLAGRSPGAARHLAKAVYLVCRNAIRLGQVGELGPLVALAGAALARAQTLWPTWAARVNVPGGAAGMYYAAVEHGTWELGEEEGRRAA